MVWKFAPWAFGVLVLAALVVGVLHIGEFERFSVLVRTAQPQWLLLAAALQIATYVAAAAVWQRTLVAAGDPRPLRSLVPLGLAKLFTDQALPSGGVSGSLLLLRALARRGVAEQVVAQTLLIMLVSFYSAYLVVTLTALGLLWLRHQASFALVSAAALFAVLVLAVSVSVPWLKEWSARSPPKWIDKFPRFAVLFETVTRAPLDLLRNKGLLAQTLLLQLAVFVLDALTFWVIFRSLGEPVDPLVAFVTFVMGSVVASIGIVPLGLGTFEVSAVATLRMLGVEVEIALAATLLLRGLTFWLPMLPGVWLARRELGPAVTRAPAE